MRTRRLFGEFVQGVAIFRQRWGFFSLGLGFLRDPSREMPINARGRLIAFQLLEGFFPDRGN
jgi:hypothetical protein